MTLSATPSRAGLFRRLLIQARRGVDHDDTARSVYENGGLSARYMMMIVIAAAIAMLGMMMNAPVVVIGAMLVSPMMGPIMALGFSLALLDWEELKRSLIALSVGVLAVFGVALLLTLLSPLKEPTAEVLSRTRPNFFDLLIAIFSGVAGAYAVIKARGDTIIGVAIATALLPPVCAVGFGVATGDLRIAAGGFFLFMTNMVAIAFSATVVAGYYGFRPRLLAKRAPWRGVAVVVAFVLLSVPLALSLHAIALESRAVSEGRSAINDIFSGAESRVTLLDARSQGDQVTVSALVSTRALVADAETRLQERLTAALHVPVQATLDQIVVADPKAASRAVQASATSAPDPVAALRGRLSDSVPFATDAVMVDGEGRRALVLLRPDSGLDLHSAFALEQALRQKFDGKDIWVTPPVQALAPVDLGDPDGRAEAVWALARWRARPQVRFCRARAAPEAEGETPKPGARESFLAQLAAAGVEIAGEEGPACQRSDENLARLTIS